jgi:hypothetical protein
VLSLVELQEYSLAGVGLTSRRTTEKERHLTVGDGLLGQIVVDNQGVLSIVSEPLYSRISACPCAFLCEFVTYHPWRYR